MTDSSNPEPPTLPQQVGAWVGKVYSYLSWETIGALSPFSKSVPKGPTPAQEMRMKLETAPPDGVQVPAGATVPETTSITQAMQVLMTHLEQHDGSDNLDEAGKLLTAVMQRVAEVRQAVAGRLAQRQKELTDKLAKVAVPDGAPVADLRSAAKRRGDLGRAIGSAADIAALVPVDTDIDTFAKDMGDLLAMVPLRAEAAADLAAFRAEQKALAMIVDRGFHGYLLKVLADADKALTAAAKPGDLTAMRKTLTDARDKTNDAKAYAKDYETWSRNAEVFIAVAAAVTDKDDLFKLKVTLADAAAKKAGALDFAGARAELAKFKADGRVGANLDEPAEFAEKVGRLMESGEIATIKAVKPQGWNSIDTDFAAARKKGIKDNDFAAAIVMLDTLIDKVEGLMKVCPHWAKVSPLVGALPNSDPVKVAFNAAKTDCTGGLWDDAVSKLTSLAPNILAGIEAKARLRKLTDDLAKRVPGTEVDAQAHVQGFLTQAGVEIGTPDLVKAGAEMDKAETAIAAIEPWANQVADVRALRAKHDSADDYKLMEPAKLKSDVHDYKEALKLLRTAAAGYGELVEYRANLAQVTLLKTAADPVSDAGKAIAKALTDADDLGRVQKKIGDARKVLLAILAMPDLAEAGAEAGQWVAIHGKVDARHKKIAPTVEPAAAKKTVDDSLSAAVTKADVDHDYPAATALLEAHDTLLTDARDYVALRKRAVQVKAALDRAAKTFASDPTLVAKILGGPDDTKLKQEMAEVDKLAVAGDVSKAAADYAKLLKSWKTNISEAGKAHEDADGKDSNAGHSLARHGPEVDDTLLLNRLVTGIAADGKESTTKKSSRFDNFESWLQAREESARQAEAVMDCNGNPLDLSAKSIPIDTGKVPPFVDRVDNITIDHGGPIDKAYVGVKPGVVVNTGDGKIERKDVYETYEELTGISKSKALWLFEIDWTALTAPPFSPIPNNHPKTPAGYLSLWQARKSSDPLPTSVPGKWVMMQLFPIVDNWNQELQDYV
ncbi:MAG: hypothetical protein KF887_10265 [Paracoccaceae bacterium]|nr:MAG: hypothetical protein KF887_10265 [Paracoccaceae bacterium]